MTMMLQASMRRLSLQSLPTGKQRFISVSSQIGLPSSTPRRQASLTQIDANGDVPMSIFAASTSPYEKTRRQRRQEQKDRKKVALRKKKSNNSFVAAGLTIDRLSPYVRKDSQYKTFKPITHSLRWVRKPIQSHLYKGRPLRRLTIPKRKTGGRNHHGHITVRGRGGGHRRRLRLIDFWRRESGVQEVQRIEYDPGRSAHIALIEHQETKKQSYILATEGLGVGDTVESYRAGVKEADNLSGSSSLNLGIFRTKAIRPGNVLPLKLIPIGTEIHCISLIPHGSAKLVRSAGGYGQLVAFGNRKKFQKPAQAIVGEQKTAGSSTSTSSSLPGLAESTMTEVEETTETTETPVVSTTHAQVKLQSGEVRWLLVNCSATIGRVSNAEHDQVRLGKAGRTRWMGRKPKVRGVAMNAVDHPHGGGRGKSKSNMHPKDIWGNKTKGPRTRKPGTPGGNKMVVRERPRIRKDRRS